MTKLTIIEERLTKTVMDPRLERPGVEAICMEEDCIYDENASAQPPVI
jgi:hypothetical protein